MYVCLSVGIKLFVFKVICIWYVFWQLVSRFRFVCLCVFRFYTLLRPPSVLVGFDVLVFTFFSSFESYYSFYFFFSLPMVFPYFPSIPFCIRIWRVDTDFGHSLNFKTYASMWRFLRRCFFPNIFVVQYFKFFFTFFISLSYFRCFCCWSIHHLKWK